MYPGSLRVVSPRRPPPRPALCAASPKGIALRKRAGALATSFWTQLFFLGILGLLSAFFDAAAYSGRVERTPGALPKLVGTGCTDSLGADLPCCSWRQGWGWPVYMSFCAAAGLWTYGIMIELKLYMMSGAIAEWYYSPTPPRLQAAAAFHCQRCAWSTSFGSVALSAVAMGLWRLVAWPFIHARATVNVVCMALTGRGFTSANEGVFERLTDAFTAVTRGWFAATFLLYNPLWLLSAFGGICVFLGEHYGVWGDVDPSSVTYLYTDLPYYGQPSLLFMRVVLAVLCFVVLAMGLTLGASYVTDALAVLFFCYTEDPDPSSCAEALVPTVMVTLLGTHRKLEANIVMPSSPGGGSSPSRTPYKGTPGGGYPGVTYVMGSGMSMTAAARANSVARPRATEEEEMQLGSFTTRNTNPFFSGPPPATLQPRSTAAASYMNSNTWQSPSQQTQSYRGAYPVSYYGP